MDMNKGQSRIEKVHGRHAALTCEALRAGAGGRYGFLIEAAAAIPPGPGSPHPGYSWNLKTALSLDDNEIYALGALLSGSIRRLRLQRSHGKYVELTTQDDGFVLKTSASNAPSLVVPVTRPAAARVLGLVQLVLLRRQPWLTVDQIMRNLRRAYTPFQD